VLTLGARIEEPAAFVARLNDLLVTLTDQTDGVTGVEAQDERDERAGPDPQDVMPSA
jgi:alkanesulfonate monooxygenase SsuD/methylene tetrahydromethanopterin reductase-like flavin-dependent oxidoreductase (luciferase family)